MFAGLMSRWTMPLPCAAASASAISIASPAGLDLDWLSRDAVLQRHPSRNSMAIKAARHPGRFRRWCRCWDGSAPKRLVLPGENAQASGDLRPLRRAGTSARQAVRGSVFGLIHHAHATAAQLLEDTVVGIVSGRSLAQNLMAKGRASQRMQAVGRKVIPSFAAKVLAGWRKE